MSFDFVCIGAAELIWGQRHLCFFFCPPCGAYINRGGTYSHKWGCYIKVSTEYSKTQIVCFLFMSHKVTFVSVVEIKSGVSTILNNNSFSATILDKINGKPGPLPLPPKSRMGKWRVLAFARLHTWYGGDGGLLFHFILSKIVVMSWNVSKLTTPENTITYHNALSLSPQNFA